MQARASASKKPGPKKDRTFYSMYLPYGGRLAVPTSLIAKWSAGTSISAFPSGVLGSIPSEFSFS